MNSDESGPKELGSALSKEGLSVVAGRTLLLEQIHESLEALRLRPGGATFAVLALNIDRFHLVSDTLGFVAADQLLSTITHRLAAALRGQDRVAQVGDDEFAVLISDLAQPEHAMLVGERIRAAVEAPCVIEGTPFHVNASAGLALAEEGYTWASRLLQEALAAARQAQRERPGSLRLYTENLQVQGSERLVLDSELRQALKQGEIHAYFQPLVGLEDGKTRGFEALARWIHPERGVISPAKFIPIAEESGMIRTLGAQMIELALDQVARWRAERDPGLFVSVNVAVQQLDDPHFDAAVLASLHQRGLSADALHLEITESALVLHPEAARACLQRLTAHGIRISLDDFGTGYSAFSSLHQFPIHTLKIDRSLLPDRDESTRQRQLFDSLCVLAEKMGLHVVVEGVESQEQAGVARRATQGLGQGFLWSKPMPAGDVNQWLVGAYN